MWKSGSDTVMASKRKQRYIQCERKIRYANESSAASKCKALRKKLNDHALGWYRCKFCGGYHIGHRPKKLVQSIRSRARVYGK